MIYGVHLVRFADTHLPVNMMNVHARLMTVGEVRKIALPVLEERFSQYGFGDVRVAEDEAYDGTPVFRVDADVTRKVPATVIVDTLEAIHSSLRASGEERIVFLTTKQPRAEQDVDEDVD